MISEQIFGNQWGREKQLQRSKNRAEESLVPLKKKRITGGRQWSDEEEVRIDHRRLVEIKAV